MKTFLILVLAGKIVMSVGPIPVENIARCPAYATDLQSTVIAHKDEFAAVEHLTLTSENIHALCVQVDKRPELDQIWPIQ
jgi:hypothetical protein